MALYNSRKVEIWIRFPGGTLKEKNMSNCDHCWHIITRYRIYNTQNNEHGEQCKYICCFCGEKKDEFYPDINWNLYYKEHGPYWQTYTIN